MMHCPTYIKLFFKTTRLVNKQNFDNIKMLHGTDVTKKKENINK